MKTPSTIEVIGVVIAHHRNAHFKVRLDGGHVVNARCGGHINKHKIKCGVGDLVRVELTPYDLTRARIVYRWPAERVDVA